MIRPKQYWKTRRKESGKRKHDRKYRIQLAKVITDVFKKQIRKSKRTLIKVRALRSDRDRCLQRVDLITYLYGRKRYLEDKLRESLAPEWRQKKQQEHQKLQEAYQVIEPNIVVQRDPIYYLKRPEEKFKETPNKPMSNHLTS